MELNGLLDSFPLWTIFPVSVHLALVSVEVGYLLARRSRGEKEAPVGGMVGATLGLLAFMLAFTFGMAASRFEDRRQVLLSEANAIGTTYLRSQMLPEPMRTEAQHMLREYVDVRLEGVQPGKLQQAIVRSEELQNGLWSVATVQAEKEPNVITSLFIQSLNEVIDLHATRVMAGVRSRIPGMIWIVLCLIAVVSMVMMGYHAGLENNRRSIVRIALVIAFASVLYLIVDLDRPGRGMLKVSQQVMIDLRKSMSDPQKDTKDTNNRTISSITVSRSK